MSCAWATIFYLNWSRWKWLTKKKMNHFKLNYNCVTITVYSCVIATQIQICNILALPETKSAITNYMYLVLKVGMHKKLFQKSNFTSTKLKLRVVKSNTVRQYKIITPTFHSVIHKSSNWGTCYPTVVISKNFVIFNVRSIWFSNYFCLHIKIY